MLSGGKYISKSCCIDGDSSKWDWRVQIMTGDARKFGGRTHLLQFAALRLSLLFSHRSAVGGSGLALVIHRNSVS